jgi:hypothetical protein
MSTSTNTYSPTTETIKRKTEDLATTTADKAQQAAASIGQQCEDATHSVGSGMKSLADTVRQKGPQAGVAGSAASSLAQGLEKGGQYLEEQGLKGIADDVTNMIRRNPLPALLLGIGLGYVLARATLRR